MVNWKYLLQRVFVLSALLLLAACSTNRVTSTVVTPLEQQTAPVVESQLLDLAVLPFEPGLENIESDDTSVSPTVRTAEAQYLPNQLAATIQKTGAWGAVRLVPGRETVTEVYVAGKIVASNGETLALDITVTDSSNRHWYTKSYTETVGNYAYNRQNQLQRDPFQGLYNRIANDLLEYRQQMSAENVNKLRTIAELRFARDFSPEAFSDHIRETPGGQLEISRLPAENDPILQRIRQIRQRDYLFIDTMQEHYDAFTRRMDSPYQEWRAASYNELVALRELKRQSRNRTIGGVAAIIGGILASGSNSGSGRAAGAVAIGSGALLVKSGLSKRAELQIHEDTLAELAQSLEAEIEPRVIELEDRTITLTGNAAAQYAQWKTLLREIYQAERGGI
ncbi:MAG: hypothetical protein CMK46_09735 [Porticoccus sp.]|uniref:hypothetical protein n=1 Tax=Porticoccus sp. TaxID=2024853 RepID=UPI0005620D95|nr:hypothetical protein [Porticoccus sp.]MAZ70378.1 hypothetical protein [Porticoccus sp.]MBG58547.1 hypothetical protein [Porticoccus sp.]